MKPLPDHSRFSSLWTAILLLTFATALGQEDDRLIGVWTNDKGFQVTELLFRSDGRYQLDTTFPDPVTGFSFSERGHYEISGQALTLSPYGEQGKRYEFQLSGDALTLIGSDLRLPGVYHLKTGSKADVLARENVEPDLVGAWGRRLTGDATEQYTFRPGGYYFVENTFATDIVRGRYEQDGTRLTLKPYGDRESQYEVNFFGEEVTLIQQGEFSTESATYEKVPGSPEEVRAKATEAEAFLSRTNWQVGVWEVRDASSTVELTRVDLTLRPDGLYKATNSHELARGTVRGRYTLEPRRLHLLPFVGQDPHSSDAGHFGKIQRILELDYYDGELQLIDQDAIWNWITIARKALGTEATVMEKVRQAQAERESENWYVGIWDVNDSAGWMEFTLRLDHRYIAKSGKSGVPGQVERGQYRLAGGKLTLAPYPGLGKARGFEVDLYDGDWSLSGDLRRLVIARKVPGSEAGVVEKTRNPDAMKGERGSILGLWTANLPGHSAELVFRPDGQFRLSRCRNNEISRDYGLYAVDMATRTLVYDSRFVEVQTQGLDFYGETMTIYGGLQPPSTYTVNLGAADAAIAASLAADAAEAEINAQWLTRVPIGPRDPNAVHLPIGDIPADPNPGRIFDAPTVFTDYQLYVQLRGGSVYFIVGGSVEEVLVVNRTEWFFVPTGRVLVRFTTHRAGLVFPTVIADVIDVWGAYRIEPKPSQRDILHLYADNSVFVETDLGERREMTLEDGRRHLFWKKDYQRLVAWFTEEKPIPCQLPDSSNPSLLNTGVALSTSIAPDSIGDAGLMRLQLTRTAAGELTLSGTAEVAGTLVTERTSNLASPILWQPLRTNSVPAGPFSFQIPQTTNAAAYFRVRGP